MEFNKLVRDKIPQIIEKNGETVVMHIANDAEYEKALENKIYEEIGEFLREPSVEEVADIMEVLYAFCFLKKVNLANLEQVMENKALSKGKFEKRIILEETRID